MTRKGERATIGVPQLDEDMTPTDIADELKRIVFINNETQRTIRIDRGIRDFFLAALTRPTISRR
jgi:hypothetical protein